MFKVIMSCNTLVYIPAHNNLKYFFPIIFLITKMMSIQMHYLVIGGWLVDFLKSLPIHRIGLARLKMIYPETRIMSDRLKTEFQINNVIQLHNFRMNTHLSKPCKIIEDDELKLVFMARVQPMKGVDTIFKLSNRLKELTDLKVSIDIYGQIQEDYKDSFYRALIQYNFVTYKGSLDPDNINETLMNYNLMLFPTKYFTEGFPGSILDAYHAGVPVIATRWKYADEFIEDNISGVITEFNNDDDFVQHTIELLIDANKIKLLKKGANEAAKKYSTEAAWEILKKQLF